MKCDWKWSSVIQINLSPLLKDLLKFICIHFFWLVISIFLQIVPELSWGICDKTYTNSFIIKIPDLTFLVAPINKIHTEGNLLIHLVIEMSFLSQIYVQCRCWRVIWLTLNPINSNSSNASQLLINQGLWIAIYWEKYKSITPCD